MGLLGMLRNLGDRLGILEVSPGPQPPSAPIKIQTRTVTLTELSMTIQITEVQSLAERPAESAVAFEEIFKAAAIAAPASGWTIDRLGAFLNSERFRGLNRVETQREILSTLAAEKTDPADIIKDAISRDQALDAFAETMEEKRRLWRAEKQREIQELEKQLADEEQKWNEWRRQKRGREQEMARTVGYLIDEPVISIDDE